MHIPVLLDEVIDGLAIKADDIFLDGTLGSGGHSLAVCKKYGKNVKLIGVDLDADALARSEALLNTAGCSCKAVHGSFENIENIRMSSGITTANKILLDLGYSSVQMDDSGRGFSFLRKEGLSMSLKWPLGENDTTASDIVNDWSEEHIADIIYGYGEERFSRQIAAAIVKARAEAPILDTHQLAALIEGAIPKRFQSRRIHPATKTFQALRIAVNDELGTLARGMANLFDFLAPSGRLAIISFHSLEDRIVKNYFKQKKESGEGSIITKKPIIASIAEKKANPRSRSAKLRIIEKK